MSDANSSGCAAQSVPMMAAYGLLMEQTPLPLALLDRDTLVVRDANAALCRLLDAARVLLIGQPFVTLLPEEHREQVQALLSQVARSGAAAPTVDVHTQYGAEPARRSWAYTVWPTAGEPNEQADLVVLVTDTTGRHRDEQAVVDARAINEQLLLAGLREQTLVEQLQRQLAFTAAISGSLGEGVYALDCAGRITYVNRAAERILGWAAAELIGSASDTTLHWWSTRGAPTMAEGSPLRGVLGGGTAYWDEDAVWARRDGTTFPVALSVAPIVTSGQVVGAVVAFRDMTDVRRLQQAQDEYIALISHDLRAPLTVMLGRSELLRRELMQGGLVQGAAAVQIVIDSGERMDRLIEDLVERSLLQAGAPTLRLAPVDLVQLCARIVAQDAAEDTRVRVASHAGAHLVVSGDAARIERVLVNLLTNARKFSAPGSLVAVRVERVGDDAVVSVADQGRGVDPEDLPHLFEKHYRARTAGRVAGTGLGLYISRLLVEAHGGRLWAESAVGVGSTFRFSLPIPPP
jgi:PAS domain S-box-containing protein